MSRDDALGRRRPDRYHPLSEAVPRPPAAEASPVVRVVLSDVAGGAEVVAAVAAGAAADADLVVLPPRPVGSEVSAGDPRAAAEADARFLAELAAGMAGTDATAVTTVVEVTHDGPALVSVAVAAGGVTLHQPVLHPGPDASWARVRGDRQKVLAAPTARGAVELSVLAGDDPLVPEAARLALLGGAEVLVLCWDHPDPVVRDAVAVSRAVENGVGVVLASRSGVGAFRSDGTRLEVAAGVVFTLEPA